MDWVHKQCVFNVTLANGMIFDIYQGIGATERGSNSPLNAIGRGIASVFPGLTMNDDTKASIDRALLVPSVVSIGAIGKELEPRQKDIWI